MHGFKTYLDILPTVQFEVGMKASHQPGVATLPETPSPPPPIYIILTYLKKAPPPSLLSFKATVQLYNPTTLQLYNPFIERKAPPAMHPPNRNHVKKNNPSKKPVTKQQK